MADRDANLAADAESFEEWKRQLEQLPDLRLEKVLAIRAAIGRGDYDVDARIDEMVRRMEDEVGALCREDDEECDD